MAGDRDADKMKQIHMLLRSYFPDHVTFNSEAGEGADSDVVLSGPEQILPYIQTVLFEEHLLELQIDSSTRTFFANIVDELPELVEFEVGDRVEMVEPDYEPGSYLKELDTIILTPLNPAIGNALAR